MVHLHLEVLVFLFSNSQIFFVVVAALYLCEVEKVGTAINGEISGFVYIDEKTIDVTVFV